jgi:hypothetical protein
VLRRDAGAGLGDGARTEVRSMLPRRFRRFRHPLIWSPIAAVLAQLLLAAVVAGATGGGDFPRLQGPLTLR